jgi:hypothetical protein
MLTKDDEWLLTRVLVWASGVAPHPFAARFGVSTDAKATAYSRANFSDMPEIRDWAWTDPS